MVASGPKAIDRAESNYTGSTRIPMQAHTGAPGLEIKTNRGRRFLQRHVQEEPAGVSLVSLPQTLFVGAAANRVVERLGPRARR